MTIQQALDSKRYQQAIDQFNALHPAEQSKHLIEIAIAEAGLEQWQQAYAHLKQASELKKRPPHVFFMLGKVASNFNPKEAKEWYKKSIDAKEDEAEAKSLIERLEEEDAKYNLDFVNSDMTFANLIGMKEVKEKLVDHVINAIKYKELYLKQKKRIGSGFVFYGGPGCGKTFAARCLAGEVQKQSKLNFRVAVVRISKVLDMYVGNSEKNISRLFEQARKNAPCILFFDEFDALGRTRSSNSDQASDSSTMSKVVDELLAEMDGIEKKAEGVFVIAATNRPWELDESLKRSGRFNNVLYVRPPNYTERKELFQLSLKPKPISRLAWGRLARATEGYSQADIAQICDDVSLAPIKREIKTNASQVVTSSDILSQIKKQKSSIEPWYIAMKKELVGTPKTEIQGGKKYTSYVQGKLNAQEKKLYRDLIEDIKTNTSPDTATWRLLMRSIALYIC